MNFLFRCLSVVTASVLLTQCGGFEVTQRRVGNTINIGLNYDTPQNHFNKAVLKGDVAKVKRYGTPSRVNQPVDGEYPLVRAVANGNDAMVQALSDAGANWKVRSRDGKSLAYVAGYNGNSAKGAQYARLGGGTVADAQAGYRKYKAEEPMRLARQRQAQAFGMALMGAMLQSTFGGGGGGSTSDERTRAIMSSQAQSMGQDPAAPRF
jgi:hypothetical protein